MLARTLAALVGGIALALAFEPVAAGWLVPVAVAVFALTTRGLRARTGWIPGLAFGVGFYFVLTYWMRSVGVDAWIGMAAFMALFYAVLGSAAAVLHRRSWWPLWISCAWVTAELWRSGWPWSGMPWGNLSFAMADTPAADALAYVGFAGLSFLLALLGCVLAWLMVGRGASRVAAACTLLAVLAALTLPAALPWTSEADGEATVAVVQGDVPGPKGNDILFDPDQVTANHVDATVDLAADVAAGRVAAPDFVLWPENSTAVDPLRDQGVLSGIETAVAAVGVPVLVGAIADGADPQTQVLNQGIVWDPATGPGQRYTKHHPVVFGEFIPFRKYLDSLQIGRLTMVGRDMVAGTSARPLEIAGTSVADAICFDVAYDDLFRAQLENGAELITVQTSNATFVGTDQLDQQFAITRLRAIQSGRWVAVASTNGISGVISPDGKVVARTGQRTRSVLVETVGLEQGLTPATRLGPWPGRLFIALTALGLLLGLLPYRRRGQVHRSRRGEPVLSTTE